MGLKQVKSEVLKDAEKKADEIIEEAEAEADEIIEEAEEEADEVREEYENQLEEEKDAYRKKALSNAEMKSKKKKLRAKDEKLREAFKKFKKRIQDLSDEEKQSYVERCLEKVDFEPGKIIGSSKYEDFVDTEFEQRDINGIIVVSEEGSRRQDFSFDKIVQKFKDSYRKEAAKKLFEEE